MLQGFLRGLSPAHSLEGHCLQNGLLVGVAAVAGLTTSTGAFEFRCRFVERVGNVDVELVNGTIDASDRRAHTVHLQFEVFSPVDDPTPAPGGFVGWNVGTMAVSGSVVNSDERRAPGRLAPFNFAGGPFSNGNPPLPAGDPFTFIDQIDATLSTQAPPWVCNPDASVPPQPQPVVLGLNTFVSVFSFTIDPFQNGATDNVTARGNLIAGTSWLPVGTPVPPDCGDPENQSDDVAGNITYVPIPSTPRSFTCVLEVSTVPGPSGISVVLAASAVCARRRYRQCAGA